MAYASIYAQLLVGGLLLGCQATSSSLNSDIANPIFGHPEPVAVQGYDGDIMEPFLTRDGRILFFNNSNEAPANTDLFYAERLDDLHFRFRGPVGGINTPALEAVASLDPEGNFYFISNRSYDRTASTVFRGTFADGQIRGIELVPGVSLAKPGLVNFDAEISADGNTLYFVESRFNRHHQPELRPHRHGDSTRPDLCTR